MAREGGVFWDGVNQAVGECLRYFSGVQNLVQERHGVLLEGFTPVFPPLVCCS